MLTPGSTDPLLTPYLRPTVTDPLKKHRENQKMLN